MSQSPPLVHLKLRMLPSSSIEWFSILSGLCMLLFPSVLLKVSRSKFVNRSRNLITAQATKLTSPSSFSGKREDA